MTATQHDGRADQPLARIMGRQIGRHPVGTHLIKNSTGVPNRLAVAHDEADVLFGEIPLRRPPNRMFTQKDIQDKPCSLLNNRRPALY